jgi:Kef-type K+ transport system membrane component KefB
VTRAPGHPAGQSSWTWIAYVLLLVAAVAAFLIVQRAGASLVAPAPPSGQTFGAAAATSSSTVLLRVLIALAAVIITGQVLARLLAKFHQPPVIGEVIAGILLGPSLLGPEISGAILPAAVAPSLGLIAQIGVVLYMFLVGLELHLGVVRERAREILVVSHAGIAVPFLLGAWLALFLYPRLSSADVPFTSFALFMGVAMSVTAFPVLARILADRGMTATPIGAMALACAAVGDATAWCLLALVVGVASATIRDGVVVAVGAIAYVTAMVVLVRPLIARLARHWEGRDVAREAAAVLFIALLASAAATEAIGIHAIFGAFLLGALVPHDSTLARAMTAQLRGLVTILLLPAFFAFAGMRTRIDLLSGMEQWLLCGLIILVATVGKFGGTFAAARVTGYAAREAATLGILMNTRGLMELIVLNIGLELGVISPTLFAMMVLMAIVTTVATSPLLGDPSPYS